MICATRTNLEPSHYYIASNYETVMEDDWTFKRDLQDSRFQMFMKTKWLLEHIAEHTMQKQLLQQEIGEELDTFIPNTESSKFLIL
jgi:predicted XRE-type DNA-binding protein